MIFPPQTEASPKGIAILGSTGSIGRQALEVIDLHPDAYRVEVLTAQKNASLLTEQALKYQPNAIVITDAEAYKIVKAALAHTYIKVFGSAKDLEYVAQMEGVDIVLTALVGFAGLLPTIAAIKAGKKIALANKETLVVAGEIVSNLARQYNAAILPVDSEHSAIYQCLAGEVGNPIERIILTASGGPFRGYSAEQLKSVTLADALKHPNWAMGQKITIDSASMMNKGLEVIEAHWLFGVSPEQIDVVVHPQSIIHSMVEFADGSIKAQLGLPDMRLPILYAFSYPARSATPYPRTDFPKLGQLTFAAPDLVAFPCLGLAFTALRTGGTAPCILNAANEVAVAAVLTDGLPFYAIPRVVEDTISQLSISQAPDVEALVDVDAEARRAAERIVSKYA